MVIGLFVMAVPVVSQAQLVLYDDFSSLVIDPNKWRGSEESTGSLLNTDISREVNPDVAPLLRMSLTSYGDTNSDVGFSGFGRNNLGISNPGPVTTIQADVTVAYRQPIADDCPANAIPTQARTFLFGYFFNDGSSSGPTDRTGNIFASFLKVLDSKTGNLFQAALGRCADSACLGFTTVASQVLSSTWSVGSPDTLRLQWVPGTGQFFFTLNPGSPGEEDVALSTNLTVASPPALDFKALRLSHFTANCTAGRRQASTNALFGNVMLNPEAVP